MSVSAEPTLGDGLLRVALEVLDARPDHGQRRAQLVRGVGGELALAAQRLALVDERLADRHERPVGVGRADAGRDEQRDHAADHEDDHEHLQCPLLGRPVADDLEVERLATERDRLGQDPDRRRSTCVDAPFGSTTRAGVGICDSRMSRWPVARAASMPAIERQARPGRGPGPGPTGSPSSSTTSVNVPEPGPPKMKPPAGSSSFGPGGARR